MIIPAPNVSCDAKTHREMVLTRRYLYKDIKSFAKMIDSSVGSVIHFEKFNSPVSRNFFIGYSYALETVFNEEYFKVFKQARLEKNLTQQYIANKLMTSSSTISKFERGLITPSNLFIISYGMLVGFKVYSNMNQVLLLTDSSELLHPLLSFFFIKKNTEVSQKILRYFKFESIIGNLLNLRIQSSYIKIEIFW